MLCVCAGRKVVSTDTRIVKVWGAADGAPYTSIEPPGAGDINDVCVWPNSGFAPQGLGGSGTIAEGWRMRDPEVMTCSMHMPVLIRSRGTTRMHAMITTGVEQPVLFCLHCSGTAALSDPPLTASGAHVAKCFPCSLNCCLAAPGC